MKRGQLNKKILNIWYAFTEGDEIDQADLKFFAYLDFNIKNEKRQRKIVIMKMMIQFPIIGFNFWMDSYSYEFGMKYATLLLKEETEMSLEKNYYDKNFIKKEISINELLELTRKKDLIRVIIYTKDPINYIITYTSRPEEYNVSRCENKKKCLRMGQIKNKNFVDLLEKKIEKEEKKE